MSKIKIYELAKEIGTTSKEVMDFLAGKNMGVKSHMNSIEDAEANQVRDFFSKAGKGTKKTEKPAEKPAEKPTEKSAEKMAEKSVRHRRKRLSVCFVPRIRRREYGREQDARQVSR